MSGNEDSYILIVVARWTMSNANFNKRLAQLSIWAFLFRLQRAGIEKVTWGHLRRQRFCHVLITALE